MRFHNSEDTLSTKETALGAAEIARFKERTALKVSGTPQPATLSPVEAIQWQRCTQQMFPSAACVKEYHCYILV